MYLPLINISLQEGIEREALCFWTHLVPLSHLLISTGGKAAWMVCIHQQWSWQLPGICRGGRPLEDTTTIPRLSGVSNNQQLDVGWIVPMISLLLLAYSLGWVAFPGALFGRRKPWKSQHMITVLINMKPISFNLCDILFYYCCCCFSSQLIWSQKKKKYLPCLQKTRLGLKGGFSFIRVRI